MIGIFINKKDINLRWKIFLVFMIKYFVICFVKTKLMYIFAPN